MEHAFTNDLIHESSPYLLQHAHNPVDWKPWNSEVLELAQRQNKPLLISIGYAACHWCHVMEEECFEDPEVAQLMNAHFINIKIDREERPDVDQIYMDALQLLTGRGGWPLNVVAMPDGKPFWGATYLPKDQWMSALTQLAELYKSDPGKIQEYAQKLTQGVHAMQLLDSPQSSEQLTMGQLDALVEDWTQYFDTFLGGYKRAPKFMMPNNLDFLMHYGFAQQDQAILTYVDTTLTRMAYGGIFDALGGGFSRYSVDTKWHVPHFEKMLYDNGQLISLYARAYGRSKNTLYKETVEKSISFVETELKASTGGYYSSLDADSLNEKGELEEGAYYVWTEDQLRALLSEDFELFAQYYNINSYGLWEEGNYVLIRDKSDEEIASQFGISTEELHKVITRCKEVLIKARNQRPRPRLDDKILTSWNALYLQGLIDAGRYLEREDYLQQAVVLGEFIEEHLRREDGGLYRNFKNNKASIPAFLEDYAALIEAYLSLYEVSSEMRWLNRAQELCTYCLEHFSTEEQNLFYYTEASQQELIRRSIETSDNVISASNSMMFLNLKKLSKIRPQQGYAQRATQMQLRVQELLQQHAQGHANWLHGVLYDTQAFYEIAVVGPQAKESAQDLLAEYRPNSFLIWKSSENQSDLALFQNRWLDDTTLIYVCQEGSCQLPVEKPLDALNQMN